MKKLTHKISSSLFTRLLVIFAFTAFLIGALFFFGTKIFLPEDLGHKTLNILDHYVALIKEDLGSPPDIDKAKRIVKKLGVDMSIQGPGISWQSGGMILPDPKRFKKHQDKELYFCHFKKQAYLKTISGDYEIYFKHTAPFSKFVPTYAKVIIVCLALFIFFLSYKTVRWLFKPIEQLRMAAQKIGAGDLNQKIDLKRSDEFSELASSINDMSEQIQKMLEGKKQMLLAISHELRTPMTRAKLACEMLSDNNYKKSIVQDLSEMETLISEILESERLNTKHAPLNKSIIDLKSLILVILEQYFKGERIVLKLDDIDEIEVDETRYKFLIKNLIENALRYKKQEVRVTLSTSGVEVSDDGIGIEPAEIPKLIEPFYRVDLSRERKTGGYGIGLYLCHLIATAHGHRLTINSDIGKGTSVKVCFR